jgi:hypothetical protein
MHDDQNAGDYSPNRRLLEVLAVVPRRGTGSSPAAGLTAVSRGFRAKQVRCDHNGATSPVPKRVFGPRRGARLTYSRELLLSR